MKKIALSLFALASLAAGLQSCRRTTTNNDTAKVINVTGLFSITGNWSTLGLDSRAALQIAADDINAYLKGKNADFRMGVSFYDTQLIPDSARVDFVRATSAGTHFIIGPQSSAELATLVPLADAANMIVVSQGSTAGSLAIAGDAVFRFCPSDKVEGAAIANTIYNDGIKGLVTVARNDAGNLGLQTATGSNFTAKGGVINALDAYGTTTTDFTSVLASIKAKVSALSTTYGAAHTAVYLASFDEAATLFAQAYGDPVLSGVRWYGGDGVALSAILLANTTANKFAIKTGFIAPSFGLPVAGQSKWEPIATRIENYTGIKPDAFALAAYDAMWVIAYTLETTRGNTSDLTTLKSVFMQQSNSYNGVTGKTELDKYGDRDNGTFDYWGITTTDSVNYKWSVVGESE